MHTLLMKLRQIGSGHPRDDKSPLSGGRLPYLDVHYGLPYSRTYLPFSRTYSVSGGDRHTHAGEASKSCC